ncbi:hypothetical protein HMPREF3291_01605 [Bacillus sp. HMSC76G11]|nr:hypothetical protein HMPREF3291_01605 [Bacillus sp. HMSC76G11]
MKFQLRDLDVFIKVAENKSFTKAAELLFVSQPSLSKTVQKLERELNVILFDRSTKSLRLTDSGLIVYEKSKEILSKIESISVSLYELSDLVTGKLHIGIPQIIGSFFFPKIAQTYSKKFPGVSLSIREKGGLIIEKLVGNGTLDIGFVVLPIANDTLHSKLIYQDEFVLCVSSNHPMAKLDVISLPSLKNEHFILFDKSFALHSLIVNSCKKEGFMPKVAFESTQWDLVLELVSAQMGITLVPRKLANKLNNIDLVSIPIKNPEILWNIGVITKKNAYQSYALKEFIHVIDDTYLS